MIESVTRGSKNTVGKLPTNKPINDAGTAAAYGVDIDVCSRIEDLERRVSDVEKNKHERKKLQKSASVKSQAEEKSAGYYLMFIHSLKYNLIILIEII